MKLTSKKHLNKIPLLLLVSICSVSADVVEETTEKAENVLAQHETGAEKLALEQDDLSADVQDLIDEQTDSTIIDMLRKVEVIMADATDLLEEKNTGGATIATETEIIELIFEFNKDFNN